MTGPWVPLDGIQVRTLGWASPPANGQTVSAFVDGVALSIHPIPACLFPPVDAIHECVRAQYPLSGPPLDWYVRAGSELRLEHDCDSDPVLLFEARVLTYAEALPRLLQMQIAVPCLSSLKANHLERRSLDGWHDLIRDLPSSGGNIAEDLGAPSL